MRGDCRCIWGVDYGAAWGAGPLLLPQPSSVAVSQKCPGLQLLHELPPCDLTILSPIKAELLEASRAYMPLLDMETIRQDVHLSCVLPFLGKELSDTSFGDMSSRRACLHGSAS